METSAKYHNLGTWSLIFPSLVRDLSASSGQEGQSNPQGDKLLRREWNTLPTSIFVEVCP